MTTTEREVETNNHKMEVYNAKQRKANYALDIIASARRMFEAYMIRENRIGLLAEEARNDVIADCFEAAKHFADEGYKFYKNETNLRNH